MWVLGESLSPGKLGKLGIINAFKELSGDIQIAATQVQVSRRILAETMNENPRALNANLRNTNLNLKLIPTALGSHRRF